MAVIEPIKVKGLAEFSRNLRKINGELPKSLRVASNEAAQIVVTWAKSHVHSRSGRAASSIKAKSTRTEARVSGGGTKVPYYPWLDFGGKVGRHRSVQRKYIKAGRYIYPGYTENMDQVNAALLAALLDVVRQADMEVSGGA